MARRDPAHARGGGGDRAASGRRRQFQRFSRHFKPVFVDAYAAVPHESVERMLALHRAGKLKCWRSATTTGSTPTVQRVALG